MQWKQKIKAHQAEAYSEKENSCLEDKGILLNTNESALGCDGKIKVTSD